MADATVDEIGDAGILDRVLPWRRRKVLDRAVQKRLDRMAKTVDGIKEDHGLDDLVSDIERARARGERVMEIPSDDPPKKPPEQRKRQDSRPSQTG